MTIESQFDVFRPAIDAYHKRLENSWIRSHRTPPGILYHYTTPAGLLGIIDKGRIWATHARFLNDASEINYGNEIIRAVVDEYLKSGVNRYEKALLTEVVDPLSVYEGLNIYVFCFCTNDDDGYALGFRTADLMSSNRFGLRRVEYDEKGKNEQSAK